VRNLKRWLLSFRRHRAVLGLSVIFAWATAFPAAAATGVYINRSELTASQLTAIVGLYRYAPLPGRYWYDPHSGAWGLEGRETVGFILPGHNFGALEANASNGDTGVFINGRELNLTEAIAIRKTFGAVYRGRWWLDGRTGYWGREGNPIPLGNILVAIEAQRGGSGGGDNFWSSRTARGNSSGGCSYVNVGNGQTATSAGCN
jgi:hypothetical protein